MAHGAMMVVHAAAAAAAARAKVLDAFRLRGATAPERALPLAELGLASSDRALGALMTSGVIRGVDPRGRPAVIGYEDSRVEGYYLDEGAYIAERDRKTGSQTMRAVLIVVAIVLALLIPLIFVFATRG